MVSVEAPVSVRSLSGIMRHRYNSKPIDRTYKLLPRILFLIHNPSHFSLQVPFLSICLPQVSNSKMARELFIVNDIFDRAFSTNSLLKHVGHFPC